MTAIRFPSPSRYSKPDRYLDAVYRWLTRITQAHLYFSFYKSGIELPSPDELAAWLHETAWPKVRPRVVDYDANATAGQWTGDQYERQLINAVIFCLETHDGARIEARARAGGKRHRARQKKFTVEALLALDGLSRTEQAKALGCDISTIKRLRAEIKNYDPVLAGVFDRALVRVN